MTFKNKKKEILKKMSLQPDFGNYRSRLTFFLTVPGRMRFMCTQVACQNQINVLTVF